MVSIYDKLQWELDKRELHEQGFVTYCEQFCRDNHLTFAKHQKYIAQKLENAMVTPNSRLIMKTPPGHAKSTYASILAPTYYLGRFKNKSVIMTTHTQEFSDRWGRKNRALIQEPSYQYKFGTELSKDSAAVSRFDLTNGSTYYGSGILGNFTGHRGDLIVGDDWYTGIESADSEVMRQKVWQAYIWDLRTRLKPGGSIILIGTPWHEDDHFGRILQSNDKDNWDVIELVAVTETQEQVDKDVMGRGLNQALWPEYISYDMLMDIKNSLNKEDMRMWNSLYQVSPSFEGGHYFLKEDIQIVNHLPNTKLDFYGASDYAVSEGKGDYTVHGIVGYDTYHDELYVIKIWREQTTSDVWIEQFLDLAKEHKTLVWAEESGQILKSLDPWIRKRMQDRGEYVFRQQFTSATDKTSRARAIQAYFRRKKVFVLKDAWTDCFEKELLSFPSGKNDDQVDVMSLIGRLLRELVKGVEKKSKIVEYEYKTGQIKLPGLDTLKRKTPKGAYKKF